METRTYELTVIYKPEVAEETGVLPEGLEKLFKKIKAKVVKTDDWGEKSLAYSIKKYDKGRYVLFTLEMAPEKTEDLKAQIRHIESIIRWLLVSYDSKTEVVAEAESDDSAAASEE